MAAQLDGSENEDVHLQATIAVLKATVERHENILDGIFGRLVKIERLIFIGIGAVGAVGALASFFGWNILKLLGH